MTLVRAGLIPLILIATTPLAAQVPESVAPESIRDYRLIRPGLATAGQPSAETLAHLGEMGFRTVVNLRTPEEPGVAEEADLVREQGLDYVHVPFRPETLTSHDVDAVGAVLEDPEAGPVLLHCGSSNRVGGVLAILAARRGVPLEEALEEGRAAGLRSDAMTEAVRRLVAEEHAPGAPAH